MLQRTLLRSSRALRSQSALLKPSTPFTQPLVLRTLQRTQPLSSTSRWQQSEATAESGKQQADGATQTAGKAGESTAGSTEEAVKKQIEAKDKEIADLKDKYLRSVAEFRNLQERTKREVSAAREFGISAFAKELLESVDNLDRALSTVSPAQLEPGSATAHQDLSALHGGLKMTEQILMAALKKHGLERYDPAEAGEKFDANAHEATFMAPQPGKEDGTVFYTQSKGFRLNGRTLRAAKVGVVKNS